MFNTRSVSQHIPINLINGQNSSYASANARFQEILQTKLGIIPSTADLNPTVALDESPLLGQTATGVTPSTESIALDVRINSGDSLESLDKALVGTPMEGLGAAFKAAENEYGVNAYFLTALAAHESEYGKSNIAQDKKNLFGFMAYDSNPYGSAKAYSSVEESIFDVADYISKQYLKEEGKHYKGVSIDAVGESYATDPKWSQKVKQLLDDIMP